MNFSFNDKYLASLGDVEDNYLIVWDVVSGKALCGNAAGTDFVHQIKFFVTCDDQLITCQNYGIKIWKIDYNQKKVKMLYFTNFIFIVKTNRCQFWKFKETNNLCCFRCC